MAEIREGQQSGERSYLFERIARDSLESMARLQFECRAQTQTTKFMQDQAAQTAFFDGSQLSQADLRQLRLANAKAYLRSIGGARPGVLDRFLRSRSVMPVRGEQ